MSCQAGESVARGEAIRGSGRLRLALGMTFLSSWMRGLRNRVVADFTKSMPKTWLQLKPIGLPHQLTGWRDIVSVALQYAV